MAHIGARDMLGEKDAAANLPFLVHRNLSVALLSPLHAEHQPAGDRRPEHAVVDPDALEQPEGAHAVDRADGVC